MGKLQTGIALAAVVITASAWAQDYDDDMGGATTGYASDVGPQLRREVVGISPQVGVVSFNDVTGNYTSRATAGMNIAFNATPLLSDSEWSPFYMGIATGAYYSHLGATTSNFFGTDPSASIGSRGANLLVVPANLKAGINIMDNVRLSAHGGGNVTYRSSANAINFGPATSSDTGSVWRMYPNAGADLEIGLSRNVALSARPDFTFTTGNTLFMGTVGLTASLL